MNLAKQIEDIFTVCLEKLELAWWVEIITFQPACTYYFGPFITAKDAELSQNGYIEDLEHEKAQGIAVKIKQCQPITLTICQD
ncbi:DUF1816 domain-containing protein [Microcoleus sp. FACHB-672]|uniref:DUF1816 domain-containing protein n=1 Tax=Microcoleus sp. FACHB-672 TaxID=2692825 RepID=UPI00168A13BB|nr:DUF1816 domain-containing protein [Microcoleus sp. FACHB-672]MBD2043575.1 DUF1816 domain-containing protein [Microcoleus sp. FACHB-672]